MGCYLPHSLSKRGSVKSLLVFLSAKNVRFSAENRTLLEGENLVKISELINSIAFQDFQVGSIDCQHEAVATSYFTPITNAAQIATEIALTVEALQLQEVL
jgi:hypothetical protein